MRLFGFQRGLAIANSSDLWTQNVFDRVSERLGSRSLQLGEVKVSTERMDFHPYVGRELPTGTADRFAMSPHV